MQVSDDDRDPTYDDRNVTRRQTEYRGACEALLPLWLIGRFPPLPPPPTSSLGRLDQVSEFMLEVLLGLRRDLATSPFPLEFGDELISCAHLLTVEGNRLLSKMKSDKSQLHEPS
jgi:hypothetical protein